MTAEMLDLLQKCLALDPNERWTAEKCLKHSYFDSLGDEIPEKIKELALLDHEANAQFTKESKSEEDEIN